MFPSPFDRIGSLPVLIFCVRGRLIPKKYAIFVFTWEEIKGTIEKRKNFGRMEYGKAFCTFRKKE
jgi:hypothetical protein